MGKFVSYNREKSCPYFLICYLKNCEMGIGHGERWGALPPHPFACNTVIKCMHLIHENDLNCIFIFFGPGVIMPTKIFLCFVFAVVGLKLYMTYCVKYNVFKCCFWKFLGITRRALKFMGIFTVITGELRFSNNHKTINYSQKQLFFVQIFDP